MVPVVCPRCRNQLIPSGTNNTCPFCGQHFIIQQSEGHQLNNQQSAYQGQPTGQQPIFQQQPVPQQPVYHQPLGQQQISQQPFSQAPVYQYPVGQQPVYQQHLNGDSSNHDPSTSFGSPSDSMKQKRRIPTGLIIFLILLGLTAVLLVIATLVPAIRTPSFNIVKIVMSLVIGLIVFLVVYLILAGLSNPTNGSLTQGMADYGTESQGCIGGCLMFPLILIVMPFEFLASALSAHSSATSEEDQKTLKNMLTGSLVFGYLVALVLYIFVI